MDPPTPDLVGLMSWGVQKAAGGTFYLWAVADLGGSLLASGRVGIRGVTTP